MLTLVKAVDARRAVYRCDCGVEKVFWKSNVRPGHTQSCGCFRRKRNSERFKTHGHKAGGKRSRAYVTWVNIKSRCYNPKTKSYKDYGERGIGMCDRWKDSFDNFLADMGEPAEGMTIERKENDKDYCPENCRWATRGEQNLNKRNLVRYTAFGKTQTLAEWARETGIGRVTLLKRLQAKVPPEVAFATKGFLGWKRQQKK